MFKVKVIKNNEVTHQGKFQTQEEVQEWISFQESVKAFGQPSWIEEVLPTVETVEKDGVIEEITFPGYQIVHPAEYELIIEDLTAQIEAEKAQLEAVQVAQQQAGMRLMLFPQQVDDCHDLDALKATIKQMVSDIAVLLVK